MSFHFYKYKFNKSEKNTIDKAMTIVAVLHPLSALPQVIEIFATQNATGVSLATWLLFMAIGLIFLLYSIVHKIKPMLINQIIWFIMDFLVVAGVLMYG